MRPTPEQIAEAREWLGYAVRGRSIGGRNEEMIRVLLVATEPYEREATVKKLEIEFAEGGYVEI